MGAAQPPFGPPNSTANNRTPFEGRLKTAPNHLARGRELQRGQPQQLDFLYADSKRVAPKRLGYFQSLLLRKWPCLALTICIMSSLIFGMLLSALTIYLVHDATDCGQLALTAAAAAAAAAPSSSSSSMAAGPAEGGQHLHHNHQHHSAELLPRQLQLARPGADFGLGAPIESAAAAGDPAEPTGRQLLDGPSKSDGLFQRLPTALAPEHYNLFIWPHIGEPSFHFNGSLEVRLRCLAATSNITLHTLELELNEASIQLLQVAPSTRPAGPDEVRRRRRREAAPGLRVSKLSQDKQLQYSIIHLDEQLVAGREYLLRLDYVGTLNDDLAGFYKIKYERQNSTETT